jgi:hypothetical protein
LINLNSILRAKIHTEEKSLEEIAQSPSGRLENNTSAAGLAILSLSLAVYGV